MVLTNAQIFFHGLKLCREKKKLVGALGIRKENGGKPCIFQRYLSFTLEKNAIHCILKLFTNIVDELITLIEKCVVTPTATHK